METAGLWALFTSSFLASTLLPGGSEIALAYAALENLANPGVLWATATLGNTLGGLTSWLLGWGIYRWHPQRGLSKPSQQKALQRIQRYGGPLLLLSWLPVIGDPLCLAAGWAGIRFSHSLLYIGLGKGLRYGLLLFMLPASG